jgi:hypothetical protein
VVGSGQPVVSGALRKRNERNAPGGHPISWVCVPSSSIRRSSDARRPTSLRRGEGHAQPVFRGWELDGVDGGDGGGGRKGELKLRSTVDRG